MKKEILGKLNSGSSINFKECNGCVRTLTDKIWIPKNSRKNCITFFHKFLSHAGVNKVYSFMKDEYDMDSFTKEVASVVRSCPTGPLSKTYTGKTK